jgi:hypothetical protein
VRKRIEDTGSLIVGNTPEQFAAQMKAEFEVYKKVVAASRSSSSTDALRRPSLQTPRWTAAPGAKPPRLAASQAVIDRFIDALWIEDGLAR